LFQKKIADYYAKGAPIVYVDESGFVQQSPPTHGYAGIGQRCYDKQAWKAYGQRTNAIGALLGSRLLTVILFDPTIDALIFTTRLTQELLPKLPKASSIIMDNAAFYKTPAVKTTIEAARHVIQYLPVYSPHLNLIEKKWAQAKAIRHAYRCEIDELFSHHLI
jgi:transposase